MTEPRRVRTQAERAGDDHTWRHTANGRPGYATWPHTQPGNPSWWRHDVPGADDEFAPFLAEQLRDPEVKAAYEVELWNATFPRRRWWHRLTRRNP